MSSRPARSPRLVVPLLASVLLLAGTLGAAACGPDTDCVVGGRSYRIHVPDRPAGAPPPGAIVFVHGWRGAAAAEMRNAALLATADELGVALIAPQATAGEWNTPGVPSGQVPADIDELAYFDALIADATTRFDLDRSRVLVSGFSAGAMMVWNLACRRGDAFAGFAPMSGTFWAPLPADCPTGAVDLIHYHGLRDEVVPLQGRPIAEARQGDVRAAIALMARTGGYGAARPREAADLACELRINDDGRRLELCLFEGGHSFAPARLMDAWRELGLAADR